MTIYIDDAFKSDRHVRRHDSQRLAMMIGTDLDELHRFARKIGLTEMAFEGGRYHVPAAERFKASLLGAIELPVTTIAAMHSLVILGYDPEPWQDARQRRSALGRAFIEIHRGAKLA